MNQIQERPRGLCTDTKYLSAAELETRIWEAVSGIQRDPEQLRADLDAMIELKRNAFHGDRTTQPKCGQTS